MKILLVDDSRIEHMVIRSFLQERDYQLEFASNGEEGIERFHSFQPDLVLLDVIMPGIDGYEVAKRLRSLNDNWVPIIFLSGKASPEDIMGGIQAGGDDYLIKPIDKQVLLAKMFAMERIANMRSQLLTVTEQLTAANEELKRLSLSDGLTGIANRRYLDETLTREIGRCARQQNPISVLMVDIDHFKKYNDHYGHLDGDLCLQTVAHTLQSCIKRSADFVARYGGEEFCVVLPETNSHGAERVAEEIINQVRALQLPHLGLEPAGTVSVSIGVTTCWVDSLMDADSIILQADRGLYQAKQQGRNQFCFVE